MSHQKASRRPNTQQKPPKDDFQLDPKYRNAVLKLEELFPNWTGQDLQSALVEVGGDVETAIIRITEGHAEQWGSVSRKKDKKQAGTISPSPSGMVASAHHNAHPRERDASAARGGHQRGGFQRGGGRGGRGGGRGGAFAGRPSSRNQPRVSAGSPAAVDPSQVASIDRATEATNKDANDSTGAGRGTTADDARGAEPSTECGRDNVPAETTPEPPAPAPVVPNGITKVSTPVPAPAKATPGVGAVRSWAQVARPQEKPKPTPPPQHPTQVEEPVPVPEAESPQPELQPEPERVEAAWEEPTTVQAPVWDDEPARVTAHDKLKAETEGTSPKKDAEVVLEQQQIPAPPSEVSSPPLDQSTPALTLTSEASSTVPSSVASPTPPPSGKPASSRTAGSRVASRFKSDQAVVMPSFGTLGTGIGIGGMKFGSLSINDDDYDAPVEPVEEPSPTQNHAQALTPQAQAPAAPSPSAPSVVSELPTTQPTQPVTTTQPVTQSYLPPTQSSEPLAQQIAAASFTPQATTLASLASSAASGMFQPPSGLQSSIPAASTTQSSTTPFSAFASLGQATTGQASSNQPLAHGLSQYSQHGLPTHVDTPPVTVSGPTQGQHSASQNQGLASYYRQQHEYGINQANQSLLAHASQQQQQQGQQPGQQQQSQAGQQGQQEQGYSTFANLAQSFNQGQDFGGFNDQRGFYDGGYQPTSFNSRNFLGQDDHTGKPSSSHQTQQPAAQHSLSPAGGQPVSGSSSQAQSAGGAGQGQGYPPPLPYYYPNPYYSQPNPYYNGPSPGYGVGMGQPFMNVKYPPVYPPGPGPQTPASGASKGVAVNQSGVGGPPGPNSYSHSGLYGAQHHHSTGYDDMSYATHQHQHQHQQHQHQHQQHQHQSNQPNSSADYGKPPLYGLNHGQGFLSQPSSVSRHAGAAGTHPQSNPSPENAFKAYNAQPGSNVSVSGVGGVGVGVGVGAKPGDTSTRGQPIYGGGASGAGVSRFNAPLGAGGAGGGPQQGQGQGTYPQSGGESNYYQQYQRPQYWH